MILLDDNDSVDVMPLKSRDRVETSPESIISGVESISFDDISKDFKMEDSVEQADDTSNSKNSTMKVEQAEEKTKQKNSKRAALKGTKKKLTASKKVTASRKKVAEKIEVIELDKSLDEIIPVAKSKTAT